MSTTIMKKKPTNARGTTHYIYVWLTL